MNAFQHKQLSEYGPLVNQPEPVLRSICIYDESGPERILVYRSPQAEESTHIMQSLRAVKELLDSGRPPAALVGLIVEARRSDQQNSLRYAITERDMAIFPEIQDPERLSALEQQLRRKEPLTES